jgi:predicted MFS family arabinose efflux permease
MGLAGIALSMTLLGLARSFWPLVLARCLCGALNGNTGVAKSAVGEMTDKTNVAQAFALMPVMWATGVTIACVRASSFVLPAN